MMMIVIVRTDVFFRESLTWSDAVGIVIQY